MKHILFIVGSLRKESFNLQLAREAEKQLTGVAEVTYLGRTALKEQAEAFLMFLK